MSITCTDTVYVSNLYRSQFSQTPEPRSYLLAALLPRNLCQHMCQQAFDPSLIFYEHCDLGQII